MSGSEQQSIDGNQSMDRLVQPSLLQQQLQQEVAEKVALGGYANMSDQLNLNGVDLTEQSKGVPSSPFIGQNQVRNPGHCQYSREELLHIAELTDTTQLPNDLDLNRLRDLQDAAVARNSPAPSNANPLQIPQSQSSMSGSGGNVGGEPSSPAPSGSTPRVGSGWQPNKDAPPFRASAKARTYSAGVKSSLLEDNGEEGWGRKVQSGIAQSPPKEGIPINKQSAEKKKGWGSGEDGKRSDQQQPWSSPKNTVEANTGAGWERAPSSWERGRGPRPKSQGRGRGRLENDENFGGMRPGVSGRGGAGDVGAPPAPEPGHPGLVLGAGAEAEEMRQAAMKIEEERLMMQEHFKKQNQVQTQGLKPKEGEMTDMDFENMKREQEEEDRMAAMGMPQGAGNNIQQQNQMDLKMLLGQLSSAQAGRPPNPAALNMFGAQLAGGQPQQLNRPPNLLAQFQQQQQQQQPQSPLFAQQQQQQQQHAGGGKFSLEDLLNSVKSGGAGGRGPDVARGWNQPQDQMQGGEGLGGIANPPRQDSQSSKHLLNLLRATQDQQQQQQQQQQPQFPQQFANRMPNHFGAAGLGQGQGGLGAGVGVGVGGGGQQQDMNKLLQVLLEKQQQLAISQQQAQAQSILAQQVGLNAGGQDQSGNKLGGGGQDSLLALQRATGASALDSLLSRGIGNQQQGAPGLIGFQQRPQPMQQNPAFGNQGISGTGVLGGQPQGGAGGGGSSNFELLLKLLQGQQQQQQLQQQQQQQQQNQQANPFGGLQQNNQFGGGAGNPNSNLQSLMMQLQQQQQQLQIQNALRQSSGGLFGANQVGARPGGGLGVGGLQYNSGAGNQFGLGGGGANALQAQRPLLQNTLQTLLNQQQNKQQAGQLPLGQPPQLAPQQQQPPPQQPQQQPSQDDLLQRLLTLSKQSQQNQQQPQQQQQQQFPHGGIGTPPPLGGLTPGQFPSGLGLFQGQQGNLVPDSSPLSSRDPQSTRQDGVGGQPQDG
eukprot:TRINITY_DN71_c0_g1_i1.p1 TRINITY_DN71_c0_g1~~TRINITY_DN71_c0_g1_i1.p1  ORF type:complete len:986 (-),score=240.90 TRINITY_DN71_c0_g1_i1:1107-4064(-)